MPKICGFISNSIKPKEEICQILKTMLQTMKHDMKQTERYICFPQGNGGIGALQYPYDKSANIVWDNQNRRCAGLVGSIVGTTGNNCGFEIRNDKKENILEMILEGWKALDKNLLSILNGVFSLIVYDDLKKELTLAGDRYGLHPLYYQLTSDALLFATEVKGILPLIDVEPDWEGWADFFYIGHMMGTRTLVKGVHTIDSGEIISFDTTGIKKKRYFDFTKIEPLPPEEVSVEKIADLFKKAVGRCVHRGVKNTVLLSGGFDSRLTLATLHSIGELPRVISLEHADEHKGLDGALAVKFSRSIGLEAELRRTRKSCGHLSDWKETYRILDGMVPNSNLFIRQVYAELDRDMGMVWDSLALDLSLGGYHGFEADDETNMNRFFLRSKKIRPVLEAILDPGIFRELDKGFEERTRENFGSIPESPNKFIMFLFKNRVRRRAAVNPYQLYASRIKTICPSADVEFLNYVLAIPNNLKIRHRLYFELLRQHFPNLLDLPACSGGEIFFGSKDPLLILRHYDLKSALWNWVSNQAWIKAPLRAAYGQLSGVQFKKPDKDMIIKYKQCAPWLRFDIRELPKLDADQAILAMRYLATWQNMSNKIPSGTISRCVSRKE